MNRALQIPPKSSHSLSLPPPKVKQLEWVDGVEPRRAEKPEERCTPKIERYD